MEPRFSLPSAYNTAGRREIFHDAEKIFQLYYKWYFPTKTLWILTKREKSYDKSEGVLYNEAVSDSPGMKTRRELTPCFTDAAGHGGGQSGSQQMNFRMIHSEIIQSPDRRGRSSR
jgi:hypothetical protein